MAAVPLERLQARRPHLRTDQGSRLRGSREEVLQRLVRLEPRLRKNFAAARYASVAVRSPTGPERRRAAQSTRTTAT
jgi:cell division septal protein FtsQ